MDFFELGAPALELLARGFGGAPGLALWDQVVAGIAVLDFDDVAQLSQVGQLFEKNDLHGGLRSVPQ